MNQKKYLVCPGEIRSVSDGDIHYIDAKQLTRLYGVRPEECVVWTAFPLSFRGELIVLEPKEFPSEYHLDFCKRTTIV